ncbi:MAG TPA: ATP-binding protein, partial [Sideroxyarcus sp.]|nr:ATP-binding protein [Sideroxyarcus sp.]
SPFERDLLLLCAGMELDTTFAPLCASAQGNQQRAYPTFSLALAALPDPHWSALTPDAPLRRWRLIEVGTGSTLTLSPLRIDERVLHYLAGVPHLDERLASIVEPVRPMINELAPSHHTLAERLATTWTQTSGPDPLPVVQLCGDESASKRAIAAEACVMLGMNLMAITADALPTSPAELDALIRLWQREAALGASALLLDCDRMDASNAAQEAAIRRLMENLGSALIVTVRDRRNHECQRIVVSFDVSKPTPDEQHVLWQNALKATAPDSAEQVEALVSQFNLSTAAMHAACAEALEHPGSGDALWNACRSQSRPRLDNLAQRIEPAAAWDDLVLPEVQKQTLREVAAHVRQRAKVYETWGFAARGARGLGISALFSGVSGTGKTMAAEVLANELRLDLYRIDLSQVVSKYIGETEKNLRRVFDAAEDGGAILLFDEADALFGKRSEVKDSHDRYANIEVSYLLQRMEAYRGLAVLTTNLKSSLDTAFLRRIRFVVQFPFPDAAQRADIWRRIFPTATPTEGLDMNKLARLNVAGGNIRNIALNAAFLAADAGETVRMPHLLRAARSEYAKLEKPLTEAETGGWT